MTGRAHPDVAHQVNAGPPYLDNPAADDRATEESQQPERRTRLQVTVSLLVRWRVGTEDCSPVSPRTPGISVPVWGLAERSPDGASI